MRPTEPFCSVSNNFTYVQGKVYYMVDKVEQVRETSLVMESGSILACDVLVNARESRLLSADIAFGSP